MVKVNQNNSNMFGDSQTGGLEICSCSIGVDGSGIGLYPSTFYELAIGDEGGGLSNAL